MSGRMRITTTAEELKEGLFGQLFLYVFEILPYLDERGIFPAWEIRSRLYGAPDDFVVIPGLLEINYPTGAEQYEDVSLQALRDDHVVTLGADWDYNLKLWNKYFRVPERVIRQADEYPSLDRAVGIHYRGTDKNKSVTETNYVSVEDFLQLVGDFIATHPDIQTIYVASDEHAFVGKVRSLHKNLEVVNSGQVKHHKEGSLESSFQMGDHALLDCLLLSRCKYLLKCQSALSGFSKIFNPKLEAYRISANKLAPWAFGRPYFPDAFLPMLSSENPECKKILARLQAEDWTDDWWAMRKFKGGVKYKARKRYMRKEGRVPRWSFDWIQMQTDARVARFFRRLIGPRPG